MKSSCMKVPYQANFHKQTVVVTGRIEAWVDFLNLAIMAESVRSAKVVLIQLIAP